jgi:hypothetical protein
VVVAIGIDGLGPREVLGSSEGDIEAEDTRLVNSDAPLSSMVAASTGTQSAGGQQRSS